LRNLDAPFTTTYSDYLSGALLKTVGAAPLGNTAEICCGRGEAFSLLKDRVSLGVGVDISLNMLHAARRACREPMLLFVQGDATQLPLASESFDTVLFIGGIHHVNARTQLYTEVARILRPGGRALWQEPVDDFLPWRLLRRAVYQASSFLDAETEHPLRRVQTEAQLRQAGLTLQSWQTYGFLGYCLLMNSDVLVFNRALRFVPGIKGALSAILADQCNYA
ncbi:methyltransferase domain-containing protein, partial [bacterium]|nr:methyltransferase domain-containing protein [bacterium]